MLPICKLRRSVLIFGTQQRKILADRKGVLKIEVPHSAIDKHGEKVTQAAYQTINDYFNQNALR